VKRVSQLRLLTVAWLALALTSSVPWLFGVAADRIWNWEGWFLWIFASHVLNAVCPFLVGFLLWRDHDLEAACILVLVAANALFEQVFLLGAPLFMDWLRAFLPEISLYVLTLGVVGAYALSSRRAL
jgi:hypothetical protein